MSSKELSRSIAVLLISVGCAISERDDERVNCREVKSVGGSTVAAAVAIFFVSCLLNLCLVTYCEQDKRIYSVNVM